MPKKSKIVKKKKTQLAEEKNEETNSDANNSVVKEENVEVHINEPGVTDDESKNIEQNSVGKQNKSAKSKTVKTKKRHIPKRSADTSMLNSNRVLNASAANVEVITNEPTHTESEVIIKENKKRRLNDITTANIGKENINLTSLKSDNNVNINELNTFADHVGEVLKKLPAIHKIKAKQEIFNILTNYEIMALEYNNTAEIPE